MKYYFTFFLVVLMGSCQMNFSGLEELFDFPEDLNEVSGITYSDDSKILWALQDRENSKEIYDKGEFVFSVKIYEDEQEMKLRFFPVQYTGDNAEEYDNAWELTKNLSIDGNTVVYLGMEMKEGKINGNQKPYQYNYYNSEFEKIGMELTGLIENDSKIWFHPPRQKYFKILELNPFPEIRFDKEKWNTELEIGEHWGNKRWKTWKGNMVISSDYTYNKDHGKVIAIAKSELGVTYLTTDVDKTNGFKKLDYTNIDGSRIVLELIEKRD